MYSIHKASKTKGCVEIYTRYENANNIMKRLIATLYKTVFLLESIYFNINSI